MGALSQYELGSVGYDLRILIDTISGVSVNCFVLLSGYNLISDRNRKTKIIKIWMQVLVFSVLCLLLRLTALNIEEVPEFEEILKCFFPITSKQYWFMTVYILLVLFSPYINKLSEIMTQIQHRNLLFLVGTLCIIRTIFGWSISTLGDGYDLLWFTALYFAGVYIKKYDVNIGSRKVLILWLLTVFVAVAVRYFQELYAFKYEHVANYNSVFMLVMVACIFLLF